MKRLKHLLISIFYLIIYTFSYTQVTHADSITVAYFLEWPTPSQFAQVQKIYDKEMAVDVKWVSFDSGTAMSAAMASGDVQIAFSQGIPPFVIASSAGQNIQIVDIAVSYSENDNCVIREDLEIDKSNVNELHGKHVAVPIGTAAHYGFLKQMQHFKIDVSSMKIVDMSPADGAAAFATGKLDMVCGWGGALRRMKEYGNVLMNGTEKEALGIQVFDATTVSSQWAQENPLILENFLKVSAQMNQQFNNKMRSKMLPVIAKSAGMSLKATEETLAGFVFPSIKEQLSKKWLGGGTQKFLKEVADFFVSQNIIPKAKNNYNDAVDNHYLKAAEKL